MFIFKGLNNLQVILLKRRWASTLPFSENYVTSRVGSDVQLPKGTDGELQPRNTRPNAAQITSPCPLSRFWTAFFRDGTRLAHNARERPIVNTVTTATDRKGWNTFRYRLIPGTSGYALEYRKVNQINEVKGKFIVDTWPPLSLRAE